MNKLSAKVSPCSAPTPAVLHLPTSTEGADPQKDLRTESEVRGQEVSSCCSRCPLKAVLRLTAGLLLAGCVSATWAWAAHSAKHTLTRLHAPFFIIWFCSNWNVLFFPLYYLGHLLGSERREWPTVQLRKCSRFLGDGDLTLRLVLKGAAPFSLLWSVSGYLHLLSLCRISISDGSAVLCCSHAFAFLLSWIGLKDRFMGVRIVAAILSITGIVMLAYADGFHSNSITGVALGVGSASTSAFYKVLFRKHVGEVGPGAVCVLLSCVGVCNLLLHSWLCVLLYLTHTEYWSPTQQSVPWSSLCTTAALLLLFNVLVNLGGVVSYPALISLGILLTIPASVAVDWCMSVTLVVSNVRGAAFGIISAGFLLLLLPEDWDERALRWFGTLWHSRDESVLGEDGGTDTPRPKPKLAGVAALP
ncbi:solute carrier family 35 member F4 [Colossoma macropomum]|uniref:solute carrier family 35 member F4 n=1 Tax=Colossoma macropomum TaxID=42526 RepID=UPI001864DC75|nr:solute carrier family 35 member F4 [Colossoma macropomum]